jgi:hypothetical protein
MVIALNPEQEQIVGQAIEAGLIEKAEDAVELGVGTIRQQLETAALSRNELPKEERKKALRAWIDSFPTDTQLLSDEAVSRESIYGDRGL